MSPTKSKNYLKIVGAAVTLFARHGYHGTSTREIARKAGVSENTLFRHFASKEDLFWSALRSCSASITQMNVLARIRSVESIQVVLPGILEALSETAARRPEVFRLFSVAYVELQGKADENCKSILSPIFSEVSAYLAGSVARGEVVDVDPSVLVASLTATAFMHPHFLGLAKNRALSKKDRLGALQGYSAFWLNVLTPRTTVFPAESNSSKSHFQQAVEEPVPTQRTSFACPK